ncbi:Transposase [Bradyrhizobium sp. Gha]|nr:Transposase [Bradyrhizobium sp. Gha]
MADYREAFVGIDVAKLRNAVAIADAGREGEVRFFSEVDASATNMRRVLERIANRFDRVPFCYEAGPTGYGLYRLIRSLGHECTVVAPSPIPRKAGDRVKTNRRDAVSLARLLRGGELTAVWVPDEGHEAMRDLVRARAAAVEALRVHRQQVSAFMLKHGRTYPRKKGWTMRYLRWLQEHSSITPHIRSRSRRWSKQFASPGSGSNVWSARSKSSSRYGLWSHSYGCFRHCEASI